MISWLTRDIQAIGAHNGHILVMVAVVVTPPGMSTVRQRNLISTAVDIVKKNLASSRTETIVAERHAQFPAKQHKTFNEINVLLRASLAQHTSFKIQIGLPLTVG